MRYSFNILIFLIRDCISSGYNLFLGWTDWTVSNRFKVRWLSQYWRFTAQTNFLIRPIQSWSHRLQFWFNVVTDHWHHFIAPNPVWQKWQLWKSKWIQPESLQSIVIGNTILNTDVFLIFNHLIDHKLRTVDYRP